METEAVLNRPLVYVENDINSRALIPSHFLTVNYEVGAPYIDSNYLPEETTANNLVEIWKKGQSI